MTLWSYKVARDFGFAPNPFFGVCTLATCKPQIRHGAKLSDIVVGCGCKANELAERIIFAMEIAEIMSFDDYWSDERFFKKRPTLLSGYARAYGDNIYHKNESSGWIQEDSHHSFENGELNAVNAERDLKSENVLIGWNFLYWGSTAIEIPEIFRDFEGDDLFPRGRNYRNSFSITFEQHFKDWFESHVPRGRMGLPGAWPEF